MQAAVQFHIANGGTGTVTATAECKDGPRPSWGSTASLFDIPRSTLQRHVAAAVNGGGGGGGGGSGVVAAAGRKPVLSLADEQAVAAWIRYQQFVNLPATRASGSIYEAVRALAVARGERQFHGVDGMPSDRWFAGFSRRHGPFRPHRVKYLEIGLPTRSQVVQWVMNLAMLCAEYNIGEDSIWNVDESGLDGRYGRIMNVIVEEGAEGSMISTVFRDHFTVVAAICANGQYAPPMWIAQGKAPITPEQAKVMLAGTIEGSAVVNTVNGWIDHATWTQWLQFWIGNLSVKPTAERPVLLILDSHSSRFTWQALQFAMDRHVIIYTLLPKTTAFAQPLDVLIFGAFKVMLCYVTRRGGLVFNLPMRLSH